MDSHTGANGTGEQRWPGPTAPVNSSNLDSLGFTWTHLDSLGLTWSHLDSLGFTWTHLDSLGLTWTHLDSIGLTWIHLDSLALGARRISQNCIYHMFCWGFIGLARRTAPGGPARRMAPGGPAPRFAKSIEKLTKACQDPPGASRTPQGSTRDALGAPRISQNRIYHVFCWGFKD